MAWADDTWLFGANPADTYQMLSELEPAAAQSTGLLIRWDKGTVADFAPWERDSGSTTNAIASTRVLRKMTQAKSGDCVRILGATVQIGQGYAGEWEATRQKCWHAFHLRRRSWKLKGSAAEKMRMLHLSVWRVLDWCAGGRFWDRQEFSNVYSMMLQMSRRALNLWPKQNEEIPAYFRRTARCCEQKRTAWQKYHDGITLCSPAGGDAGHLARLAHREPYRLIAKILSWRDASYRRSVRGLVEANRPHTPATQQGLPSIHRTQMGRSDPEAVRLAHSRPPIMATSGARQVKMGGNREQVLVHVHEESEMRGTTSR